MSVIGFDIGNESCVIAAAKQGGIDVLLNDEAKRATPSLVSFGDKQRFLGSAGAAFATSNPKSTITQIKRLIGRLYKEPSVQEDLKLLPFVTSEGPRGGIVIELEYLNKKWTFTPVEILGMLFTHLKQIAEKNLESPVVDCVIGIPSYFTDLQRREYLAAACIAGLRPLRLIHDGTAIAIGYGNLSTSGPTVVIFVDIGHCDTQVTVASFEQGRMKILSHSFDPNLGGRDFDEVLFRHFSAQFKEKYKIDVYSNARASIRLRASCEKVKKVLSANVEAPISIECLIGDTDVRGLITREEFEKLSQKLLERVSVPCVKAVEDSGISVDKIYNIELVGSGSRIPVITKILTTFFNKEPTRTLNASECVARGCTLCCAMLSPTAQVRNYQVEDIFPYSIALPLDELKGKSQLVPMVFRKGRSFPSYTMITHIGKNAFYFRVSYTNLTDFPAGLWPRMGHFQIGSFETAGVENVKVELKVTINVHGIVEIESAHLKNLVGTSHTSSLEVSANLDVAATEDELREAKEREQMLSEQDKKVEETKDLRNALESFVYETRSKLSSAYRSVTGFDIGNESCVIAVAKGDEMYVLLNDESSRETPSVVSFGEKQRFLGSAGVASATANPESTISQIKRLIGRQYKEPSVQQDLKLLPFVTSEGPRGGILIELNYLNKKWTFTPVEILGMLFTHLKQIAEKDLGSPVVDCVIGIPSYFSDLQRCEYLDAAFIAGLRPLSLMHDCTAIALMYDMFREGLSKSGPTIVVFVDIGNCDTQVTVASFEQGGMEILSHSFDENLGGRDFDEVLFKHFAAQYKQQCDIDVCSNLHACTRLRASCEKLKKVLSDNEEAQLRIDRLMYDEDLKGFITREEFEKLSLELLEKVTIPCLKALNDSGLSVDNINGLELVGSGSHIPAIRRKLTLLFKKEPTRTLNSSKCVAVGCTYQCAMLSPTNPPIRPNDYEIQDSLPYTIGISLEECKNNRHPNYVLFQRGSPFPCFKEVTFHRSATFKVEVYFTNETDFPVVLLPGSYFMIGPFETSGAEKAEVKVRFHVNHNGIIKIESALLLKTEHFSSHNAEATGKILGVSKNVYGETTKYELLTALEIQHKFADQDITAEQTKEKRNILEAFVYDTRKKLRSSFSSIATDSEKERIFKILQETEDWLYEDGDDESEQVYIRKLKDLVKVTRNCYF